MDDNDTQPAPGGAEPTMRAGTAGAFLPAGEKKASAALARSAGAASPGAG